MTIEGAGAGPSGLIGILEGWGGPKAVEAPELEIALVTTGDCCLGPMLIEWGTSITMNNVIQNKIKSMDKNI